MEITVNVTGLDNLANAIFALANAAGNSKEETQMDAASAVNSVPTATATPTYSMEQLAVAATGLIDAGKMQDVQNTLASLGAQTLMDLPQEKYGEFASAIKAIGAVI